MVIHLLRDELLRVRPGIESARDELLNNFKQFLSDLNEVRMESIMEDDFILWILVAKRTKKIYQWSR